MKTILFIIFLILTGFIFGQENKIKEEDTIKKTYSLILRPINDDYFTPEEKDYLFYHNTPEYCFDEEFKKSY